MAACDDTTFLTGSEVSGEGWCGVTELFDSQCTSCHSPANLLGDLDLQTDPHGALVDVASAYPGRTLVVPGDPAASFLLTKLEGTQADTEGSLMPQTGALPQETIDLVSQWIADGASDVCDTTTPSTCDPTNEECGPGVCSGDGPRMLPGADCLQCHTAGGGEAPEFTAAGTAFVDLDGSAPLEGAAVRITDAGGKTVDLTTNDVGNFYTSEALTFPISASIEVNGTPRDMFLQPGTGGCNSCHRCDGQAGGKLYGEAP